MQFNLKEGSFIFKLISVTLVSVYLLLVLTYLILRGRVKTPFSLIKLIKFYLRKRPYQTILVNFDNESDRCWVSKVPDWLFSNQDSFSNLILLEDGKSLGPSNSHHSTIRNIGNGSYNHWGNILYFSTSDNSDPRTNGRKYEIFELK